jgi:hypothetical protein
MFRYSHINPLYRERLSRTKKVSSDQYFILGLESVPTSGLALELSSVLWTAICVQRLTHISAPGPPPDCRCRHDQAPGHILDTGYSENGRLKTFHSRARNIENLGCGRRVADLPAIKSIARGRARRRDAYSGSHKKVWIMASCYIRWTISGAGLFLTQGHCARTRDIFR